MRRRTLGTTHVDHLEQNLDSGNLELTAADLSAIEAAFPKGTTAGPRYTDMSNIYL